MTRTDRLDLHDLHVTRLADIENLPFPEAAPRVIRFSPSNQNLFQLERAMSFPGGHSKEQGGTIVSDSRGVLSVQNLGGLGSDKGEFSPNLAPAKPDSYRTVGMFHTHPYDHSERGYSGVSFSGGDFACLINYSLTISVVQSGPRTLLYYVPNNHLYL